MRKDSTTAKFTQLNTFEERLLRNLTGRAEWEIERNKRMFTPLNLFCISFNRGPKDTSLAQLNRVPFGKFNRVKTVLWHQSSEG